MTTAGVYARISLDRSGDGAGVERQVDDAERLATDRGFIVVDRYVDNDRSAYSGRERPEWNRLLTDLQAGRVQTVVAWSADRLYRRTRDQLDLMEAVAAAGGRIATTRDGDVDPSSAEGRMRMGILANVAEFESARKAERVTRASEKRAASGKPHGRAQFGWLQPRKDVPGERVIDPEAATLIREAASRVLGGESCGTIVADWNDRGVATAAGAKAWDHRSLRKLLRRPMNAGLRVHRGEVLGPATAPPILEMVTWESVVARLSRPGGQRRPRTYLLTGVVTCVADGERMVGHQAKNAGYECVRCHTRIAAAHLDALVTDAVLAKLVTPRFALRLAGARSDDKEAAALADLDRAHARLGELASMFGAGDMELAEYRSAQQATKARRDEAAGRLATRRGSRVLDDVIASPDGIRGVWERQGMPWRREVIGAVLERVEIGPSSKPAWEPERAVLVWRTA